MRVLRREMVLCDEIGWRSTDIKEKLNLEREDKRKMLEEQPMRHPQTRSARKR